MRQIEKERKKFQSRIPFIFNPGKKIPIKIAKKIKIKTSFRHSFQQKQDEIGQEREKKTLISNSIPTQPGIENSKKNSKKIQKIKKPLSDIIYSQNGMRQAKKEKKKMLLPNSVQTRLGQENSEKNSKKIEKIKKTSFRY